MSINKILYIGAADHIQPVCDFKEVKEFIFIDSQPLFWNPGTKNYSERAMYMLLFQLDVYGFKKVEERRLDTIDATSEKEYINPTLLIFQNESTKQNLKYYVSCPFPFEFSNQDEIVRDIEQCDALLVSGFFPHVKLFDHLKIMKSFIGYSSTCFAQSDRSTFIDALHNDCDEIKKHFEHYYFVEELLESRELHWVFYNKNEHEIFRHHLKNFIASDVIPEKHVFDNFLDFYEFSEYQFFCCSCSDEDDEASDEDYEVSCEDDEASDEDMSDVL